VLLVPVLFVVPVVLLVEPEVLPLFDVVPSSFIVPVVEPVEDEVDAVPDVSPDAALELDVIVASSVVLVVSVVAHAPRAIQRMERAMSDGCFFISFSSCSPSTHYKIRT
jgi:hypothetical protein